jgi:hypothetical protein
MVRSLIFFVVFQGLILILKLLSNPIFWMQKGMKNLVDDIRRILKVLT